MSHGGADRIQVERKRQAFSFRHGIIRNPHDEYIFQGLSRDPGIKLKGCRIETAALLCTRHGASGSERMYPGSK